MRIVLFSMAALLAACSPPPQQQAQNADELPSCRAAADVDDGSQPFVNTDCSLEASGRTLHVRYAPVAGGGEGAIVVEVLSSEGQISQTLNEAGLADYLYPITQDVDGDGNHDLLVGRERGNVNTIYGVWLYDAPNGRFVRAGEISSVDTGRTADGYVYTRARSSAAEWLVSYYRVDGRTLAPLASVGVRADVNAAGQMTGSTCKLEESQGIAAVNLTRAAAETKFCNDAAAKGVFD